MEKFTLECKFSLLENSFKFQVNAASMPQGVCVGGGGGGQMTHAFYNPY